MIPSKGDNEENIKLKKGKWMRSNFEKEVLVFHKRFLINLICWLKYQSIFIIVLYFTSELGIYYVTAYLIWGFSGLLKDQWRVLYKISINNGIVTLYLKRWNKTVINSISIYDIELYENPYSGILGHSFKIKSRKVKYIQNYNNFVSKEEIYSTIKRFDSYKKRFIKLERRRKRNIKRTEN